MTKLSWNPPKWKSYTINGFDFKVELETGEVYTGFWAGNYVHMGSEHSKTCYKIFGQDFTSDHSNNLKELSRVLDLNIEYGGGWPEYPNVKEFIKRYYDRVAKIENSNKSKIYIETEFNITPKFTL